MDISTKIKNELFQTYTDGNALNAALFIVYKTMTAKTAYDTKTLYGYYVDGIRKQNGTTDVSEAAFFKMAKDLSRYTLVEDDKIRAAEKFKTYLDGLSKEEFDTLKSSLYPNFTPILSEEERKRREINENFRRKQYDAPYPSHFNSIKEEAQWECEHDIILQEFGKGKNDKRI